MAMAAVITRITTITSTIIIAVTITVTITVTTTPISCDDTYYDDDDDDNDEVDDGNVKDRGGDGDYYSFYYASCSQAAAVSSGLPLRRRLPLLSARLLPSSGLIAQASGAGVERCNHGNNNASSPFRRLIKTP